jgi:hypothetical protein
VSGPARLPVTEAALQTTVVDLAILYGWRIYHSRPAWIRDGKMITPLQGHKGFPDLIMVRPPRLIVAELKSDKGQLTIDQQHWLEVFAGCLAETYCWRPSDLPEIQRLLERSSTLRAKDPAALRTIESVTHDRRGQGA